MTDQYYKIAAKCIIAGFKSATLPYELSKDAQDGCLGGVILFKRNVESALQVHTLLKEIKNLMPKNEQPVLAVDQEGGRVIRIREPLTVLPPAELFGKINDENLTFKAGELTGKELRALGFTVDFAPVMDINTNPASPVIGDRSYGRDSSAVIKHGLAFARGLKKGGVFPCAKHFPGHGDATVDSHKGLPFVDHSKERLNVIEMEPFKAWSKAALGPVMTAHVVYPALDSAFPATMSQKILTGILRDQFHFSGVIFTDDLEMGAINRGIGASNAAVKIIDAGADALLVCSDLDLRREIIMKLADFAKKNDSFFEKLKKGAGRLSTLAYPQGKDIPYTFISSEEHLKMAGEVNNGLAGFK